MSSLLTAIEFFSGIGAFADACRNSGIEVIAAFDQNEYANKVYESNFQKTPRRRNLESVGTNDIDRGTSIWWMSPPCTPFTRRGARLDDLDPRSQAILNLIEILPKSGPEHVFVENVVGFEQSRVCEKLVTMLELNGYKWLGLDFCSSQLRVPMRRPRHFIVASKSIVPCQPDLKRFETNRPGLKDYLRDDDNPALVLPDSQLERYRQGLHIVDPEADGDPYLICFTRGYYQCRKAAGSLIQLPDGRVRFVSPSEILNLFGFSDGFAIPPTIPLPIQWKLIGNSIDVRAVKVVLSMVKLI